MGRDSLHVFSLPYDGISNLFYTALVVNIKGQNTEIWYFYISLFQFICFKKVYSHKQIFRYSVQYFQECN